MINRTKVIGTAKALELLKAGHPMRWSWFSHIARFHVDGQRYSVRYGSHLEIVRHNSPYHAHLIVTRDHGDYIYTWHDEGG